jgi:hypothetical protein
MERKTITAQRSNLLNAPYKIEFWYKILEFKKKMPRRLLKVGTKRLILTCFETFIEANGKTTHKDEHHQ